MMLERDMPSLERALVSCLKRRRALIITTPAIVRLHQTFLDTCVGCHGADCSILVIDIDEQKKSMPSVIKICEEAFRRGVDRTSVLVSIGGGVCSDVVTVAASFIRRGITHLRIPTTLLAQVDAAVGIKGAVNLGKKKSAMGCFYSPEAVLIDPHFLTTLPDREFRNGCAEIIKIAAVCDPELFILLESNIRRLRAHQFSPTDTVTRAILWKSIVRMLEQLEPNLYETQTYERAVDFGHTFSPAVESASLFRISHGEAVAIDMALCTVMAWRGGWLPSEARDRVLALIRSAGLPTYSQYLTRELCFSAVKEASKHRGGHANVVVLSSVGMALFISEPLKLERLIEWSLPWLRGHSERYSAVPTLQHSDLC
jgi:3-dehydroquinate synthase